MTIVADVVPPARRAAGIGIVMTAFSVASALGVPAGLYLSQKFEWETPFMLIAVVGAFMWMIALLGVPSLRGHFAEGPPVARWKAMGALASNRNVQWALLFMSAMVGAHFTIIPFMSPYLVANVGLAEEQLSLVYLTGGILTIFTGPFLGRLADRMGRPLLFLERQPLRQAQGRESGFRRRLTQDATRSTKPHFTEMTRCLIP